MDYPEYKQIDLAYVKITELVEGDLDEYDNGTTGGYVKFTEIMKITDDLGDFEYDYAWGGAELRVVEVRNNFENLTFTIDPNDTPLEKLYTYQDKWDNKCYTVYLDHTPSIADGTTNDLDGNPLTSEVTEVTDVNDSMLVAIKHEAIFNSGTTFAVSVGDNSVTTGIDTIATGKEAVAMGQLSVSLGSRSAAIGRKILARGSNAIGLGYGSTVTGRHAIAFNEGGKSLGYASLTFGDHSTAYGAYAIAGGYQSVATKQGAIAVGHYAKATGRHATAIG